MARTISIGNQNFESIRVKNYFYIDKTYFIKEWWDNGDTVTLITRPRRFGKTLTISMTEQFFSTRYANRSDLFEELFIWQYSEYKELQGTYPVISLSFASIKEMTFQATREHICRLISALYNQHWYLLDSDVLKENEKKDFLYIAEQKENISETIATTAIHKLSDFLSS